MAISTAKTIASFSSSHSQPRLPRGLRPCLCPYLCAASVLHPHSHHNRRNRHLRNDDGLPLFDRTRRFPFASNWLAVIPGHAFSPQYSGAKARFSVLLLQDRRRYLSNLLWSSRILFRPSRRCSICRVVRPDMFGITPFHLLLHLTIRPFPEGPQITRDLQRPLGG